MKKIWGFIATISILGISVVAGAEEASKKDQAVIAAMMQHESNGAVIGEVPTCFVSFGIYDPFPTNFLGFFGLFPDFTSGDCGNSFERTNKDGSVDTYIRKHGSFFMFWFDPFLFMPSEGSDIYYRWVRREDGNSILNVEGTTSDGGRIRIHLSSRQNGKGSDDVIWLENYGYLYGGPKK